LARAVSPYGIPRLEERIGASSLITAMGFVPVAALAHVVFPYGYAVTFKELFDAQRFVTVVPFVPVAALTRIIPP
jgi:hypothetical protein